ncbi:Hypothetical predicted protein [Pelobates cultripes]|uniref:Uncharacterized protein n=1 Tax=Pelobates cultripes TaxID=61616 RepID=A0AAD1SEU0_PELCU|nr:Hypothetical predicted protein [Pelobates cultripes]
MRGIDDAHTDRASHTQTPTRIQTRPQLPHKVWKADLKETQAEVGQLRKKIIEAETRDKSQESQIQATQGQVTDLAKQVQQLTPSVTTLEARHRRWNIRVRGALEHIGGDKLLPYINHLVVLMGLKKEGDPEE